MTASRTVPTLAVVGRCFEGQIVFHPHHIVARTAGDVADALHRLRRTHPAEGYAFDLDELPGSLWFFAEDRVLLSPVRARRIVQEHVARVLETRASCPGLLGQPAGKLFGVLHGRDGEAAIGMKHDAGGVLPRMPDARRCGKCVVEF